MKKLLPIAMLVLFTACSHMHGKSCGCSDPRCECVQTACKCKKSCDKAGKHEHKKKCKVCEESEKSN